ncbi:MAG: FadR/GntR family transcriptional regulator [Acetobacteraceae bacterium]
MAHSADRFQTNEIQLEKTMHDMSKIGRTTNGITRPTVASPLPSAGLSSADLSAVASLSAAAGLSATAGLSAAAGLAAAASLQPAPLIADPVRGSTWVTAQLRRAILGGQYAHGEKLPAERQFAAAFGASRATIRTALVRLESERLVTRRLGSGTYVSFQAHSDSDDFAELTGPLELIDVRLAIEPAMVRLAVLNATVRDLERIATAVARMESSNGDAESFTLWDREFHQLICEATRNPLMVWVYRQINAVRTHTQWNAMKDKILTATRITEYNQQHAAIFNAIRSRDVEKGVAMITSHLHAARRQLLGASAEGG